MASIAFSRESIIASIKDSIASQLTALRELGLDSERIAQLVFAASMAAGKHSGPASVAGDASPVVKPSKAPKEKKAKDPDAPKKPMNAGLADYNARFDAWWSENKERLEAEWEDRGKAYQDVLAHHQAKCAEYEKAKEKAESKGKELKKSEPRAMPSKMNKPIGKIIFSLLPQEQARQAVAADAAKAKAKEKAASKKSSKASSVSSASETEAAAAGAASVSSEDDEDWTPFSKDGKDYIYNDQGHCYLYINGEQGSWAGIYDAETDILDDTIEAP